MTQIAYDPEVRPPVALTVATDDIFRPSGRFYRDEVEALCVDWDNVVRRRRESAALAWFEKSLHFGLQMFVVGSRENLLSFPALDRIPVTLIEKPLDLHFQDEYMLMEWLTRELASVYASFRITDGGFLAEMDDMNSFDDSYRNKLAKMARTPSAVNLQSATALLTDEEHEVFLKFLKRPASEPHHADPGRV